MLQIFKPASSARTLARYVDPPILPLSQVRAPLAAVAIAVMSDYLHYMAIVVTLTRKPRTAEQEGR